MYYEYLRVKNIYKEIHQICIEQFMKNPKGKDVFVYDEIICKGKALLEQYEQELQDRTADKFYEEIIEETLDDKEQLSREIQRAYHSVWMPDSLNEEDAFFSSVEQVGLREWKNGENPYRDLQYICSRFQHKRDVRHRDFVFLFEKLLSCLKQNLSAEKLAEEVDVILHRCGEELSIQRDR